MPVDRLVARLGDRFRVLGLSVSLWDPAGMELMEATGCGDLCALLCKDRGSCKEAASRLAQQACLEEAPAIATAARYGTWNLGTRWVKRSQPANAKTTYAMRKTKRLSLKSNTVPKIANARAASTAGPTTISPYTSLR